MVHRVQARALSDDEGNELLRIVHHSSGSVVTCRRAQMVLLSAQDMDVPMIAKVTSPSMSRVGSCLDDAAPRASPPAWSGRCSTDTSPGAGRTPPRASPGPSLCPGLADAPTPSVSSPSAAQGRASTDARQRGDVAASERSDDAAQPSQVPSPPSTSGPRRHATPRCCGCGAPGPARPTLVTMASWVPSCAGESPPVLRVESRGNTAARPLRVCCAVLTLSAASRGSVGGAHAAAPAAARLQTLAYRHATGSADPSAPGASPGHGHPEPSPQTSHKAPTPGDRVLLTRRYLPDLLARACRFLLGLMSALPPRSSVMVASSGTRHTARPSRAQLCIYRI